MKIKTSKYIIVGAGLSGLTTAYILKKNGVSDFIVLEARSFNGGRILTHENVDLGATWFQQPHKYLKNLLEDLGLDSFPQYQSGKSILVYDPNADAHYFNQPSNEASARRISGGSIALINKLSEDLKEHILLNIAVNSVFETFNGLQLDTNNGKYEAEKVIITLPPKLASTLRYTTELPKDVIQAMTQTHTWMSNAIKVGLVFESPFWRDSGFSGTLMGQYSPVTELYDHCNFEENKFCLMGFVSERLRNLSSDERKFQILNHLEKYFGNQVNNYMDYFEKDWLQDEYTTTKNIEAQYLPPRYGNEVFSELYMSNKLMFSGTETSPIHGGYLEGAVVSGWVSAQKLLK